MKSRKNQAIGVFDSGVGGLTVVKSLRKHLPNEDIIYFGDTARVPYGNKSRETVKKFSREIIEFLIGRGAKIVVAACNTASSLAVPAVKKEYSVPVLGVIDSGARVAALASKNGRIGVIGTDSTIMSRSYDRALKKCDASCKLFSRSCPLFVPLVENEFSKDPVTRTIAKRYLKYFDGKGIDTLILGCTHYPILKTAIQGIMKKVTLVDSATGVAKSVVKVLEENDLRAKTRKRDARIQCFVSDDPAGFKKVANIFLKEKFNVKKVVTG